MTVTELALLKVRGGDGALSDHVKAELRKAKDAMQSFSGHRFYYLQQVEDPKCIYVLGEWVSLHQHVAEFIPSEANQRVLEALRNDIDVEWLSHLDVRIENIALDAPVLSLGRHIIAPEKRNGFEKCFTNNKKHLENFTTEGNIAGGWKLDEDRGNEEFVLFAPWKGVDQHFSFASTDGFKEYARIRDYVDDAEIKHVKVLDLERHEHSEM